MPDPDKALSYCNQAFAQIGFINNDSITAKVHLEYGSVYLARNEKILALKNFMNALRLAEDLNNENLLRAVYSKLSSFYALIDEIDKAIDYQMKAYHTLYTIKTGQTPYNRIQDLARLGDLYGSKKNYDVAMKYYEHSLRLADSVNFQPIKAIAYRSIINNYLAADQPQNALDYFNNHPQLKQYFSTVGFGHFIDQSYGYIYNKLGNYDSAKYYYTKAAPFFENDVNKGNKLGYYYQLGMVYKSTKEYDKALEYFLRSKVLAEDIGELKTMSGIAGELDSIYQFKGDYKQAFYYASLKHQYKDSLQKLGKEKDLLQIEAADEQQRQDRLIKKNWKQNVNVTIFNTCLSPLV